MARSVPITPTARQRPISRSGSRRRANHFLARYVDIPDDPARPQYTAVLTWKPNETFAEDVFTFTPPEDAKKTEIGGGALTASQPSPGP